MTRADILDDMIAAETQDLFEKGMSMRNFHVRYGADPWARAELVFAIELARLLAGRLFIWFEAGEESEARAYAIVTALRLGTSTEIRFCQGDPRWAVRDRDSTIIDFRPPRPSEPSSA